MFGRIDIIDILYSLPAVFLAFSFHEFAHALAAYSMGDPTPKFQGRLTLDPLAHVDWIGLIMFTIFGFGWAKPVQVNPSNFKNRKWGDILVSIAGPIANLVLALFAFIVFHILIRIVTPSLSNGLSNGMTILLTILDKVASLNIVFAFLNLIPIAPFDGYHIVKTLFFRRNIKLFWILERYSMIILFAMILLNIFAFIISPPYRYTYGVFYNFAAWLAGIFF